MLIGQNAPPKEAGRAALSGGECTARTPISDHLRWTPNFTGNTITICTTFFITRTKSKDGQKWLRRRRFSFPRNAAVRQWFGSGTVGFSSWECGLSSPGGGRTWNGRNRRRQTGFPNSPCAGFGSTLTRLFFLLSLNRST